MTNSDFLNLNATKELLLFDIYDVDEFVLRESKKLHNYNFECDLSIVKRLSFSVFTTLEKENYQEEINTEDYLKVRNGYLIPPDDIRYYSRLNYEDFEAKFPIDVLDNYYDDWLTVNCEHFFKQACRWIESMEGDISKKICLRDLINKLKSSLDALNNIQNGRSNNVPVNRIQKEVIEIHKSFNSTILSELSSRYTDMFPELFKNKQTINKIQSKKQILKSLINSSKEELFDSYEDKLIAQKFLSEDRNKWLKRSSDLVRFYNYCERGEIVNRAYQNKSKGMKLLRQLYNFFDGQSIDSPRSKRLKQDEAEIGQFNFLDII